MIYMSSDDWKYYDDEDLWEEEEREEENSVKKEILCPFCARFVDSGSTYCTWCGRPLEK